jgi:hypothetical protein
MAARWTLAAAPAALAAALVTAACTPTVRVQVEPINIYAKLDADVRVRLDREVQTLIQQNPVLF